jgi:deoxyadenosine/deoxycytidine kinase
MSKSFIFVEGNIGVGKSTLFDEIKRRRPDVFVHDERLGNWRMGPDGRNLLNLFYGDPATYAFEFQSSIMTEFREDMESLPPGIHVYARSPRSAMKVFTAAAYDSEFLSNQQVEELNKTYQACRFLYDANTVGTIYLQTNPDFAFERTKARARPEERSVTLGYIRRLHRLHEQEFERSTMVVEELYERLSLSDKVSLGWSKFELLLREVEF